MKIASSKILLAMLAAGSLMLAASAQETKPAMKLNLPVSPGPFQPTMASLTNYTTPDWFRDAKFGIWAHWGPQAVPMNGDWYARRMYEPGNKDYTYHTNHYGHPSEFGYKDIIPLWKAEKWDPDRLMQLYKKAGAKYFVSMGSHHDNFFLWNSKLHRWNAVNMGPKRDVVGDWQKAAQKYGLRFGVSEHLGASFTWFQSSHRADKTGPKAGVPYDGSNSNYWDLYHFPAEPGDTGWYSTNPKWHQQWYDEIKELVDNYHPDLLYTDGGVAFGKDNVVGLSMIAHLYNQDAARHGGKVLAVYNCKQKSDGRWVEDLERGIMPKIEPYPWQTDTSIGDWFYDRNWKFRPVSWVIHMLVDNVSKNGNLLLNIVQRPDGSLDPEVETMLEQLAVWNAVHGEAIYGSRPWFVYGESAVQVKGGAFKEDFKYNAKEIRFTTKGSTLYAIALGWPEDGQIVVRSLAKPAGQNINNITGVSLLGYNGKLEWKQTAEGLVVTLPPQKVSEFTTALKIAGTDLKAVAFAQEPAIATAANSNPFLGNWALTIPGGGAGWLGVTQENGTLKGSILWGGGSVVPVTSVRQDGSTLVVTRVNRNQRKVAGGTNVTVIETETIKAKLDGDNMSLTTERDRGDGKIFGQASFTGKRIPPMGPKPDLARVKFGAPITLFNGENLDGWQLIERGAANGWSVKDGVLINDPKQEEGKPHKNYGNLRTTREFEDFNLKLETNVPTNGNSGIYLRGIYEVQVMNSFGKRLDPHNMGAIYSRITPTVAAEKPPGEWQTLDITLVDRHATVILNGQKIIDNQPLLGCTGGALWSDQFRPGPLYLQGDHTAANYRNVVIRPVVK